MLSLSAFLRAGASPSLNCSTPLSSLKLLKPLKHTKCQAGDEETWLILAQCVQVPGFNSQHCKTNTRQEPKFRPTVLSRVCPPVSEPNSWPLPDCHLAVVVPPSLAPSLPPLLPSSFLSWTFHLFPLLSFSAPSHGVKSSNLAHTTCLAKHSTTKPHPRAFTFLLTGNFGWIWAVPDVYPYSWTSLSWQTWLSDDRMGYNILGPSARSVPWDCGFQVSPGPLSPRALWPPISTGWGVKWPTLPLLLHDSRLLEITDNMPQSLLHTNAHHIDHTRGRWPSQHFYFQLHSFPHLWSCQQNSGL